jgi:hypothetical protein
VISDPQVFFRQYGYLHIPGALGKEVVQPVKTHIVHELKQQKIWSTGRSLSRRLHGVPLFQQVGKLGQWLRYPALQQRLAAPTLIALMRKLAAVPLASAEDAQLLISLPDQGAWTLKGLNWHRDVAQSKLDAIPGVQAFVLIDDLSPRAGATLALTGSHKLRTPAGGMQSLARLIDDDGQRSVVIDGIELAVLEMTGKAGDVYLMDMRVIHTPSINAGRNVRMMATMRYLAL